jgi:hypothetical protein
VREFLVVDNFLAMINNSQPIPFSQAELILLSMFRVSKGTNKRIEFEEVVIRAWQDFPSQFSLKNHPEFPDGSSIPKRVADNLRPKGLVVSLGDNSFRLTDKGINTALELEKTINNEGIDSPNSYRGFSRDEENFFRHALSSRAYETWVAGKQEDIIDYDAKIFYQFSTATRIKERLLKVRFAEKTITKGIEIGFRDSNELLKLNNFLINRFKKLFKDVDNE